MDIISQTLLTTVLDTLLKNWRVETMIAIIVFLLTYYFMQKRINKYKLIAKANQQLVEKYEQDMKTALQGLKTCHEAFEEIKQLLLRVKEKQDREILLEEIQKIVEETTK